MKRVGKWGAALLVAMGALQAGAEPDPRTHYFIDGWPVHRGLIAGDPADWIRPIQGLEGTSAGGKVELSRSVAADNKPALRVKFLPNEVRGQVAFYSKGYDISALRDSAALAVDMRLLQHPHGEIAIGMECGWPCRAELMVDRHLQKRPLNEWFTLSIPLRCFKSGDFNLTKVNAGFMLLGSGHFELELGDIRLDLNPADVRQCL